MLTRLNEVAAGSIAQVVELDDSISTWRERLQAYGVAPGRRIEVVQHNPVTVVRVERTDIAFEAKIAGGILVSTNVL